MRTAISIIALTLSTLSYAGHSLREGLKMIRLGGVDTSSIVIKYSNLEDKNIRKFWDFKNQTNYKTKNLFQNLIGNEKSLSVNAEELKGFQELRFENALTKNQAKELLKNIYSQDNVEYAIFNPRVEEAVLAESNIKDDQIRDFDQENLTPNFENKQYHLNAAPEGVDARFGWTIPGGTGVGVTIIDMESGVNADHEDLKEFFFVSELPEGKIDHGTAVAGEMVAKRDGKGVTGISYDAAYGFYSRYIGGGTWGQSSSCESDDWQCEQENDPFHKGVAANLAKVIEKLNAGDLIVLEMHSPGPRGKFIPNEYWTPVYKILKFATEEKGIHCVAAGGNGHENLDHKDYHSAFDINFRDSGCVLVGAALSYGDNRHIKAGFSNYGSRIDAFGYGKDVVTSGYGDLHRGVNANYTASFSGTSSATPIVGGAMASLIGMAKEQGMILSPKELRAALRKTGTPQKEENGQRIGNLPNIKEAYKLLFEK